MREKEIANKLLEIARESSKESYNALNDFIYFLIDTYDVERLYKYNGNYVKLLMDRRNEFPKQTELMALWFQDVADAMEQGKTTDWFGSVYESMFQSKGKASSLGQFYTPESLCHMMAQMTVKKGASHEVYNDCACGSGRTLLAAFQQVGFDKFNRFVAGDIDPVSCKMCALNMMIHGMIGEVKQQDALKQDTPVVIYRINEVRWPIPNNYYSIRRVYPKTQESVQNMRKNEQKSCESVQKAAKSVPKSENPSSNKPIQLELF